jgi:hypothetical protein
MDKVHVKFIHWKACYGLGTCNECEGGAYLLWKGLGFRVFRV